MTSIGAVGSVGVTALSDMMKTANDYLKDLSVKHPNLQLRAGTVTPAMMRQGELKPEDIPPHGAGNGNVFIDSRYLRKVQSDPEEAKRFDDFLKSIPEQEKELKDSTDRMARALEAMIPGSKVEAQAISHGFFVDKDGNVGSWVQTVVSGSTPSASERAGAGSGGLSSGTGKKAGMADQAKSAVQRLHDELMRALEKKEKEMANATTQQPFSRLV